MLDAPTEKSDQPVASPTWVRYAVLGWLCAAAIIAYMSRNSIGVAVSAIQSDLGLRDLHVLGVYRLTPEKQMGWVISAFFVAYAVLQLPSGWLSHIWGTRRALPVFSILWSITTGLFALAFSFPALLLSRFGMGAAQAGIFPCSTNTISKWFPKTERALPSGALGSMMSVGAAIGTYLTGVLLGYPLSWRWIFLLYSVPGIVWAVWFFVWFRDHPQEHPSVNADELERIQGHTPDQINEPAVDHRESTPWRAIFSSSAMWCISGQQFFRAAGYTFYASWFATFLKKTHGVSDQEAGFLNSFPFWGVVLGSFVGGVVSDWVLRRTGSRRLGRQGLAIFSQLAGGVLLLLAFPIGDVGLLVFVISISSFCASWGGACAYVITIDMGGKHVATVFSVMNMAGNVGAILFPVVVPELVDATGRWDLVLVLVAGIYLAAAVCWLLLNPNGTIGESVRPAPRKN